ncbi:hypothetical protein KFE25_012624 [Diacronema lutheri]|uniref:EF-hand domain-containing protein n=1 Tax=Diacronema lutheri TaxID=2081491 RepID=A0A8J6C6N2_DIALT|nr:hypothetical protein KFE25_012624 [Diacronema lutheri]
MGNAHAANLTTEEMDEMLLCSHFTEAEVKKLFRAFRRLDEDGSGQISRAEFMQVPSIASNPLVQRVMAVLDKDNDNEISFAEFVQALSVFSSENEGDKLHMAFKIYDIDGDGFITNGELFTVLKMMVGDNLGDAQLQQVVDKTMIFADKDKDGKVSFDEFCEVVASSDVELDQTLSLVIPSIV